MTSDIVRINVWDTSTSMASLNSRSIDLSNINTTEPDTKAHSLEWDNWAIASDIVMICTWVTRIIEIGNSCSACD